MSTTKTGLVPQEDMGTISLNVQVAPGSSLAETEEIMTQVEDAIKDIPEISIYSKVSGKMPVTTSHPQPDRLIYV